MLYIQYATNNEVHRQQLLVQGWGIVGRTNYSYFHCSENSIGVSKKRCSFFKHIIIKIHLTNIHKNRRWCIRRIHNTFTTIVSFNVTYHARRTRLATLSATPRVSASVGTFLHAWGAAHGTWEVTSGKQERRFIFAARGFTQTYV
jgi:hypothetical protein